MLILGATGNIGLFIAETIREAGYTVRAVSRDVARAKSRIPGDYEWVQANVRDPRTLVEPMTGADYVVNSMRAPDWIGPFSPEFVGYHGLRNLVDAAKVAQVKHFVHISTATSGPDWIQSKRANNNYNRYFKTKGEAFRPTQHLSNFVASGGTENEVLTAIRLVAIARGALAFHFTAKYWSA